MAVDAEMPVILRPPLLLAAADERRMLATDTGGQEARALVRDYAMARVEARDEAGMREEAEMYASIARSHHHWLRGGRRVILLAPEAHAALEEIPCRQVHGEGAMVVRLDRPVACRVGHEQHDPRAEESTLLGWYVDWRPTAAMLDTTGQLAEVAEVAALQLFQRDGGAVRTSLRWIMPTAEECEDLDPDQTRPWVRTVRNLLAALADPRLSAHVRLLPPVGMRLARARKEAQRHGQTLRRFELTPDGLAVWRETLIGDAEHHAAGDRAPVRLHTVAEHTTRAWVQAHQEGDEWVPLEPYEVERDEDGMPVVRTGRRSMLIAVRIPRRAHTRGRGDLAAPRVSRVVAGTR